MLEVAVIGAGTSGLVAARHLIHAGLRPTIFEAAKTIGGAWTPSSSSAVLKPPTQTDGTISNEHDVGSLTDHHPASKMWNGMSTNLSKYTCRFSDWPWPDDASTFPSVEEMHDYLTSYADAFLTTSQSSCNFQLECKVFNIEQTTTNDGNNYKVEWTDLNTHTTHSSNFGGLVVASGFFHTPRWPACLTDRISNSGEEDSSNNNVGSSIKPRLMHSSEYRAHQSFQNKNVAVIGSSFSALEIAADISKSAARVVNVLPSVPWVLPRWIPTIQPGKDKGNGQRTTMTILPADLALYQRTQPFPKEESISLTTEECCKRHEYLQSLVGQKQRNSTLGEPINKDEPPFVAISDEYLDSVREDKIEVVHGRLVGVGEDGSLQIEGSSESNLQSTINDIDHVICCTGYRPKLHNFVSPDILSTLDYDPEDGFCPMTLAWDTLHPSLPNLGFVGMYRGPYMGIIELQARLTAGIMSGKLSLKEDSIQSALKQNQSIRSSIPRAQFPHFDYPGLMDTLSLLCYQDDDDCPKYDRDVGDMIVPTFYQTDNELSQKCRMEIEKEIQLGQDGSRLPKLVLTSILGGWSFDRTIVHLQTRKVERVYGAVKYSKYWERADTDDDDGDNSDGSVTKDKPVLYREDGVYEFSPTQKFDVFREYEYEVKNDALEIYFVEGGKRTYLFLSLKFVPEETSVASSYDDNGAGYWVKATSDHLCIKDLYSATFRVKLNGLSAEEIIIKYRVKGPKKDYESTTKLKPL